MGDTGDMQTPPLLPPAGWFPDPTVPGHLRFWNGQAWEDSSLPDRGAKPKRIRQRPGTVVLIVLGVAAATWIIGLFLPAYSPTFAASDTAEPEVIVGARAFAQGAFFFWLPLGPWAAWYANVFSGVAAAIILMGRAPTFRTTLAGLGLVVAPVALLLAEIPIDEGGSNVYAVGPGAGLWLWLTSTVLVAVAAGLALQRSRRDRSRRQRP